MEQTALTGLVARANELWDRRGEINERFSDLHKQVKDAGYDVETFRQIVREHRMEREVLAARLAKLAQYRAELGMLGALGEAAAVREADQAVNGHDRSVSGDPDGGPAARARRGGGTRSASANPPHPKPKPFAETPITPPRRGRPRRDAGEAFAAARDHLGPGDRLDELLSE